ncbi:MAG: hypothetical protein OXC72_13625 [Roseovarius sp.]|nr:hypothetical protein [Roseovarius sp.]
MRKNAGIRAKSRQESAKKCFWRSYQTIEEQGKIKPEGISGIMGVAETAIADNGSSLQDA